MPQNHRKGEDIIRPSTACIESSAELPDIRPVNACPPTNVQKALVDCVLGRRSWKTPLSKEVAADVSTAMDFERAVPLTREEELILRAYLKVQLSVSSKNNRDFIRWVEKKYGRDRALKVLGDYTAYSEDSKHYMSTEGKDVIEGETVEYWCEGLTREKIGKLSKPVRLWDFGGSSGNVLSRMRSELGRDVEAHLTDIGYKPHQMVDACHFMSSEATPKEFVGESDVAMASHSLRLSSLPHIAVRNILTLVKNAAYIR
ncbi:MAG: hypothetical protein KKD39_05480, partial [Candidatus Altiarchaeota archaeon]|nr:hypothetical protein [Candidatus Altiarchaeota archaeon]